MRIFLSVLILIINFQSWTKADDIRDFQIEGMSIGDSALDYFSETKIKKAVAKKQYPKSNKFTRTNLEIMSEIYDLVQIHFKTDDRNYEIFGISGQKYYKKNINDCYKMQKKISKKVSELFINLKKLSYDKKHVGDRTGKSTNKGDTYLFPDSSYINIACYDWSKKIEEENNFVDNQRVTIISKELANWLKNEAYK